MKENKNKNRNKKTAKHKQRQKQSVKHTNKHCEAGKVYTRIPARQIVAAAAAAACCATKNKTPSTNNMPNVGPCSSTAAEHSNNIKTKLY